LLNNKKYSSVYQFLVPTMFHLELHHLLMARDGCETNTEIVLSTDTVELPFP